MNKQQKAGKYFRKRGKSVENGGKYWHTFDKLMPIRMVEIKGKWETQRWAKIGGR